jgi:hypothetical protein
VHLQKGYSVRPEYIQPRNHSSLRPYSRSGFLLLRNTNSRPYLEPLELHEGGAEDHGHWLGPLAGDQHQEAPGRPVLNNAALPEQFIAP